MTRGSADHPRRSDGRPSDAMLSDEPLPATQAPRARADGGLQPQRTQPSGPRLALRSQHIIFMAVVAEHPERAIPVAGFRAAVEAVRGSREAARSASSAGS